MTEKLKRCPFCGGRAHVFEDYGMYTVGCSNPHGCVGTCYFETREEAVKRWNTRNAGTCRDISIDGGKQFVCSACDCSVDMPLLWGSLNYCPNCGSKLVSV